MKTTFRLLVASASVVFITLAASGAPLPFIADLMRPASDLAITREPPLAENAGMPAGPSTPAAFNLN
jgi:hypothetical protein